MICLHYVMYGRQLLVCSEITDRIFISLNKALAIFIINTFKADDHIVSVLSRESETVGRMVWNIISREANIALKVYKTLIRRYLEHCIHTWAPVLIACLFVWLVGWISTIVGYLMPNSVFAYIKPYISERIS